MTSGGGLAVVIHCTLLWAGDVLHSAKPRQVASHVQQMHTAGSNIPETDVVGENSGHWSWGCLRHGPPPKCTGSTGSDTRVIDPGVSGAL